MMYEEGTEVLSYFRTSVHKYFRIFVRKYGSTFVLPEVYFQILYLYFRKYFRTSVPSKERKYFRTKVRSYLRSVQCYIVHTHYSCYFRTEVRKYFRTFESTEIRKHFRTKVPSYTATRSSRFLETATRKHRNSYAMATPPITVKEIVLVRATVFIYPSMILSSSCAHLTALRCPLNS